MSDDGRLRNISDTANWVAVYRALESERPDALFRDPFARRLAGARAARIAEAASFARKNAWSFVARTVLFDRFISGAVANGADMVVNLAAGLDARPYRMELPSSAPGRHLFHRRERRRVDTRRRLTLWMRSDRCRGRWRTSWLPDRMNPAAASA
jgi:O-methyltransferase involved in polyketide biosynthesis